MTTMTREEVVKDLARWHFINEPTLKTILWVGAHAPETDPLRLLEVTSEQSDTVRDIEVFAFDSTNDVPYPMEVVEVTELEMTLLLEGKLSLPAGWPLSEVDVKRFSREDLGINPEESAER